MQLNLFSDYSLRVLIYAAGHDSRPCTADEVATAYGISRHHLVKVVNGLQHHGYLTTIRGRRGGFTLARPPADINIGAVVRKTEGTGAFVECFDRERNTCPLSPACTLKQALRQAVDAFFAALDRYTLADLVKRPQVLQLVRAL